MVLGLEDGWNCQCIGNKFSVLFFHWLFCWPDYGETGPVKMGDAYTQLPQVGLAAVSLPDFTFTSTLNPAQYGAWDCLENKDWVGCGSQLLKSWNLCNRGACHCGASLGVLPFTLSSPGASIRSMPDLLILVYKSFHISCRFFILSLWYPISLDASSTTLMLSSAVSNLLFNLSTEFYFNNYIVHL